MLMSVAPGGLPMRGRRLTFAPLLAILLAPAAILLSILAHASAQSAPESADLLAYGRVRTSASTDAAGSTVTVFTCEDGLHADWMLDKIRADFTWDRVTGPKAFTLPGGIPALRTAGGGVLVFARQGTKVAAIAAKSPAAASATLARLGIGAKTASFAAAAKRPASMDYYDLRPISFNYLIYNVRGQKVDGPSVNAYLRSEQEKAPAFWAPFGYDANFLTHQGGWMFGEPEPSSALTYPFDYQIALGKKYGQSFSAMVGNGPSPWWIRNKFPEQIGVFDPNGLPMHDPLSTGGTSWLSYTCTDEAYAYPRKFMTQVFGAIKRDAGDDLTMVRPLGGGRTGDELALHYGTTLYMGRDAQSEDSFRRWLRDDRKLSLADLSQRWYGDPNRLKSWDDVAIPSEYDFFGRYDDPGQILALMTGWQWRPDRKDAETDGWGGYDYKAGPEWITLDLAPSYRQFLVFNSRPDDVSQRIGKTAWFRKEFDAAGYLAAHHGQPVYLVADTMENVNTPVDVWFNGVCLGGLTPSGGANAGGVSAVVTGLVHAGRNVIAIKDRDGAIYGPVFLTTHEPLRYPYLGPNENARYRDMREWVGSERMIESWYKDALPMRQLAPDAPMCICPGHMLYADRFLELKKQAGLTETHDTGAFGGSYGPTGPGVNYTQGLYFTSEEGGTDTEDFGQDRQLAWFLFEGVSHHNYIDDAQVYMTWEKTSHWFQRRERLLSLVAKSLRRMPTIAILYSPASADRLFTDADTSVSWDVGRGGLQAAHYNSAYVTETEVENGMVDRYPVLFDSNTIAMDDKLVSAIERYVHAGGTFVAQQDTGRDTYTDADTWPISRLTGYKFAGERTGSLVNILRGNPLLKDLAGQSFPGTGMLMNWMGVDHAAAMPSVALEPGTADCVPLALWEDGTVAAGMRKLGKGRVVVLGSTFWVARSDRAGNGYGTVGALQTRFLRDLFAGLGVVRQADTSSPAVWIRPVETKNGLQDWFVLWNSERQTQSGVTVTFPYPGKPARVFDEESGKPEPFSYNSGIVKVAPMDFEGNGLRVLGVDRPDVGEAVSHWFGIKAKFETAPQRTIPIAPYTAPKDDALEIDRFQFRQIDDAAVKSGSWLTEPDTAAPWKTVSYGFWDDQGFAPQGTGVYRATIDIPAAWSGEQVYLALSDEIPPFLAQQSAVYVNGRDLGAAMMDPSPIMTVADMTPYLHPGVNDLAFLAKQNVSRGGFLGGVYYYPRAALRDQRDLTSGWRLYSDDRNWSPAALPLAARGRCLSIDIDAPADWSRDDIFIDIDQGASRWIKYIMVNNRPIAFNGYSHPFPNRIHVVMAPWIEPGKANHIELWANPQDATTDMTLKRVVVGLRPVEEAR